MRRPGPWRPWPVGASAVMVALAVTVWAPGPSAGAAPGTAAPATPGDAAGYAVTTSETVTTVGAGLSVPAVSCPPAGQQDLAAAVTVGGPSSAGAIRLGWTVACDAGTATYQGAQAEVSAGGGAPVDAAVPVSAGDHLRFALAEDADGTTTVSVRDTTSSAHATATAPEAPDLTTVAAQTTVEIPGSTGDVPVPSFTPITFADVVVDGDSLASLGPIRTDLTDGTVRLVSTSAITPSGSFTTRFVAAGPSVAAFTVVLSSLNEGTPLLSYQVTAQNIGTGTSTGPLTVSFSIPLGTTMVSGSDSCGAQPVAVTCSTTVGSDWLSWTVGAGVPVGGTVEMRVAVTMGQLALTVTDSAWWTGPGCPAIGDDECETDSVTNSYLPPCGLAVFLESTPYAVTAGSSTPLTYDVSLDNCDDAPTQIPVEVTDTLPPGTTLVPGSAACGPVPAGVTCAVGVSGSTVDWFVSAGLPGQTYVNMSVSVTVDPSTPAGDLTDTADWLGEGCLTTGGCPTTTVTTVVEG